MRPVAKGRQQTIIAAAALAEVKAPSSVQVVRNGTLIEPWLVRGCRRWDIRPRCVVRAPDHTIANSREACHRTCRVRAVAPRVQSTFEPEDHDPSGSDPDRHRLRNS